MRLPRLISCSVTIICGLAFSTQASAQYSARARAHRPEPGAATEHHFEAEELSTVPGTLGEPLRIVASLPGVVRTPFGLGFFVVRGANFQNTGYFIDGFQVPLLYHLGFGPGVLPTRLLGSLNFYPGGFPVKLGRFTGGVVSLESKLPDCNDMHLEAEVDLFRASALGFMPFDAKKGADGGGVSLSFRRSYFEALLPLLVKGIDLRYADYQAKVEVPLTSHLRFGLFLFGSDDALNTSGAEQGGIRSSGDTNIALNFQRVVAKLDYRPDPKTKLLLRGTLGRDEQAFVRNNLGQPTLNANIESFTAGLRLDAAFITNRHFTTFAGMDLLGLTFSINSNAPAPTGFGEYPRPSFSPQVVQIESSVAQSSSALYVDEIVSVGPLEWSVGSRLELLRYGTQNLLNLDPRTVMKMSFTKEVMFKAASGLFSQQPLPFQLVSIGGNPNLGPERSWQNSLGVELNLPERIKIESTGYYSHMFNVIRNVNTSTLNPDGTLQRVFFAGDAEGRSYGFELMLRKERDRESSNGFYGWLSYTLSRTERTYPGGKPFLLWLDQTHTLNLALSYAIDGWRFGAKFQLASGRPTDTVTATTFDGDTSNIVPDFDDQGERLPLYHQLDVRIDRDFDLGDVHGSLYLDVLNVYYGDNAEGYVYQYDYQKRIQTPGIPVLGTLGIRLEYK